MLGGSTDLLAKINAYLGPHGFKIEGTRIKTTDGTEIGAVVEFKNGKLFIDYNHEVIEKDGEYIIKMCVVGSDEKVWI